MQTVVSGRVYAGLADRTRRVEIVDLAEGVTGAVRCATETNRAGTWSCDLGALYGDFLVKVETDTGAQMLAIADEVPLGETKTVVVSPFTHLTAAYFDARHAKGEPLDVAVPSARRLMQGHFGMIQHHRVLPANVDETLGSVLDEGLVAGFLVTALRQLAADIAAANGQGPDGSIDAPRLLSALAADVRADGVFDGRGTQGILRLGETELTGNTLRADYGRALLDFVTSDANTTGFVRSDFESLAARLANNTSELFPEDVPEPLDDTPPTIVAVEVATDPAAPLASGTPVTGTVFVTVEARDPSGLARFELVHTAAAPVDVGAGEAQGSTGHRWQLSTADFEDGAAPFEVVVVDGAGNRATQPLEVVIDNTPPVLVAEALGRSRSATVGVSGEVVDAVGPVVELTVTALGRAPVVLEAPERFWSATVELACDGQDHTVEVRAEDAAGNVASTLLDAGCDDSPPALQVRPTTFIDGDQVSTLYSPDGQSLTYGYTDFPEPTGIETVGPHRFVKYFTRLDEWSDDLPVLGVNAADDRGEVQLQVRYRYLVDGALVRGWTDAQTEDRLEWSVPVSYQTLGTELATAGAQAVHRVEVRAEDAAGNRSTLAFTFSMILKSPPIWLGGCDVDPTLRRYSLPNRNLHEVYTTRTQTPALAGQIQYRLGVGGASLAPRGAVRVRVLEPDIRSYVEAVRLDGHQKPTEDRIPTVVNNQTNPEFQALRCNANEHRWWTGAVGSGTDQGCRSGTFPRTGRSWRNRTAHGDLNDDLAHVVAVGMERSSGAVFPGATDARFDVVPDDRHFVRANLSNPSVRVGSQLYTWSTALGLPTGYVATNVPARYRGFAHWEGEGADVFGLYVDGGWGGLRVQRFVTRPYLSDFSIEMQPMVLDAVHADLEVEVEVERDASCGHPVIYRTTL